MRGLITVARRRAAITVGVGRTARAQLAQVNRSFIMCGRFAFRAPVIGDRRWRVDRPSEFTCPMSLRSCAGLRGCWVLLGARVKATRSLVVCQCYACVILGELNDLLWT